MKERIVGIDWIRAAACLSVVWVHSIARVKGLYELPAFSYDLAVLIQMAFIFATPMFVMISIYILSYTYQDTAPKGFWKKRFMYIFIPYLSISFISAFYYNLVNGFSLEYTGAILYRYILMSGWNGYFILIIFQLYFLHFLFNRYSHKVNPYLMTALAIVINILYNYYVSFLPAPHESLEVLWVQYGRVFFPGWIAFFIVAYYAGRYALQWKKFLRKAGPGIIVLALFSMVYGFYNVIADNYIVVSSRRNDVLFYTIFLFLSLIYLTASFKTVPAVIKVVSKYSFPIFLLHLLFIDFYARFQPFDLSATAYGVFAFLFSTLGSIGFSWVVKHIPGSGMIIGNIDRKKSGSKPKKPVEEMTARSS
ncbi:acyltransferase family protein [Jeotgalibacillus sp. ET6]|uniref:acyltransferase family protein n=1 Tax=Jeotgalibacillus sp. ET6 TaxID=3037260 RepID=UPI0024181F1D|nr:acyltransferase family protein [Jeotgalibacillus sp. ET6]MDG5471590.1 acyltransferase family protein [Jeotgalibacillus sp. ET6]